MRVDKYHDFHSIENMFYTESLTRQSYFVMVQTRRFILLSRRKIVTNNPSNVKNDHIIVVTLLVW